MSRQITRWGHPASIIDSEYGEVTYQEWMNNESDRLSKHRPNFEYEIKSKQSVYGKNKIKVIALFLTIKNGG